MDKTISQWKERMRGMSAQQVRDAWSSKASNELSWTQEANYHAAIAERMKQLGNMSIDLDDDSRVALCRHANHIVERLQEYLQDRPTDLSEVNRVATETDAYHDKFGSRTARYYMYEQGVIDILGDRVKQGR